MRTVTETDERDDAGFTLVELLVVVLIIGVLAGIALPVFLSQRTKAHDRAAASDLRNLVPLQGSREDHAASVAELEADGLARSQGVELGVCVYDDGDHYFAATRHTRGSRTYHFNSATGVVSETTGHLGRPAVCGDPFWEPAPGATHVEVTPTTSPSTGPTSSPAPTATPISDASAGPTETTTSPQPTSSSSEDTVVSPSPSATTSTGPTASPTPTPTPCRTNRGGNTPGCR